MNLNAECGTGDVELEGVKKHIDDGIKEMFVHTAENEKDRKDLKKNIKLKCVG